MTQRGAVVTTTTLVGATATLVPGTKMTPLVAKTTTLVPRTSVVATPVVATPVVATATLVPRTKMTTLVAKTTTLVARASTLVVATATLVVVLAGCSGSKDRDTGSSGAGGSAGTSGSGVPAGTSGEAGSGAWAAGSLIPHGPFPVTLPVVKAPHASPVTSAETFVVIDSAGRMNIGKVAAGTTPYAGTRFDFDA